MFPLLLLIFLLTFVGQIAYGEFSCATTADPGDRKALPLTEKELNQSLALYDIHFPWENFLAAAPTAIGMLGQLTILGGQKDFRLDERPPSGGFKYLRNPHSFRATMAQVSLDGWNCFSLAHRNMDSIQLNMLMIPRRVQTVVRLIRKSSLKMLQRLIRIPLNGIKEIGQLCVTLARDTENEFKKIYNMLGEIVEATQTTRGVYDERHQQSIQLWNASQVQKANLDERQTMYRQNQEAINKKVGEYEQRYRSALDSIPTGWTKLKMEVAGAIGKAFAKVIGSVPDMLGDITSILKPRPAERAASKSTGTGRATKSTLENALELSTLSVQARSLSGLLNRLMTSVSGNGTSFQSFDSELTVIAGMLPHLTENPAYAVFSSAFNRVKILVQRLITLTSGMNRDELESAKQAVPAQVEELKSLLAPLLDMKTTGGPMAPGGDGHISGADELSQANSAAQWMRYHQERADKNFAELMKNHEALGALMVRMTQINLDRIEFEEILLIIRESLVILGNIQRQWSLLTQFFEAMAVRTELAMNQTITPFMQTIQEAVTGPLEESDRDEILQAVEDLTRDIQKAAHFLHTLSKTYVEVSSQHILSQLAGMTGLSVLPADQRSVKMAELSAQSKTAENAIFQLARAKRLAYGNQVALLAEATC